MANQGTYKVTVRSVADGYWALGKRFTREHDTEVEVSQEQYDELMRDRAHLVVVGGPKGKGHEVKLPDEVFEAVPAQTHRAGLVAGTMQSDDHIEATKKSVAANAPELFDAKDPPTMHEARAKVDKKMAKADMMTPPVVAVVDGSQVYEEYEDDGFGGKKPKSKGHK